MFSIFLPHVALLIDKLPSYVRGSFGLTCGGVPRRPSLLPAGHSRRPALSRPLLLCSAARRDASLLKLEPPCAQAAADLLDGVVTKPVLCCTVMLIRRHLSQAHRSKFVPRVPVSVMGGFRRRNARNSNFIPCKVQRDICKAHPWEINHVFRELTS